MKCNRSAVLQMRERGLLAIHMVCGQADDKADAVLLNGYEESTTLQTMAGMAYWPGKISGIQIPE